MPTDINIVVTALEMVSKNCSLIQNTGNEREKFLVDIVGTSTQHYTTVDVFRGYSVVLRVIASMKEWLELFPDNETCPFLV